LKAVVVVVDIIRSCFHLHWFTISIPL